MTAREEVILSLSLLVLRCLKNKMVVSGVVFPLIKNKVFNLTFLVTAVFLTDPYSYVTFRDF